MVRQTNKYYFLKGGVPDKTPHTHTLDTTLYIIHYFGHNKSYYIDTIFRFIITEIKHMNLNIKILWEIMNIEFLMWKYKKLIRVFLEIDT